MLPLPSITLPSGRCLPSKACLTQETSTQLPLTRHANWLPSSSAASLLLRALCHPAASVTCYTIFNGSLVLPDPLVLTTNHEGPHFQGKPHHSPAQDTCPALHGCFTHTLKGPGRLPTSTLPLLGTLQDQGFLLRLWHPAQS